MCAGIAGVFGKAVEEIYNRKLQSLDFKNGETKGVFKKQEF